MIRIKKLFIKNFKGIKEQVVVDFNKDGNLNQILSGPNGYGKTTVFEALELCITGKFDRIATFKDVQLKGKNRNKPYFQNINGENVIIKLLVEKDGLEFVISKLYDDINSPKKVALTKNFIPEESHGIFFTYLNEGSEDFESMDSGFSNLANQSKINALFLGEESNVKLDSIYYLFNYIQQEESIRFLKQREDEKGNSLAFLFSIEKEESEQLEINSLIENYNKQKNTIDSEIQTLESTEKENNAEEYKKIFESKDIHFDKEEPFNDLPHAKNELPNYFETLDELIAFKIKFDVLEYEKSIIFNEINNQIIPARDLLNSILISNLFDSNLLSKIELKNATILKYRLLFEDPDDKLISKATILEFFDEEQSSKYVEVESQIKEIDNDLGLIGKIISSLIDSNKKVWEHYNEALSHKALDNAHCPLCNSNFESSELLIASYEAQLLTLKKFNQEKIEKKQKLVEQLKEFQLIIKIKIQDYLKSNEMTEESVISLIRNYPNIEDKVMSLKTRFLNQKFEFSDNIYILNIPNTLGDFEIKRVELKTFIEQKILTRYRYDGDKIENKEYYDIYFDKNKQKYELVTKEMLEHKKLYLNFKFQNLSHQRLTFLKERLSTLKTILAQLSSINDKAFATIKRHKVDMIEKIKIPFFIYSGKILQNYQQGFGIYIDITETGKKNNVVLKTGKDSDHDVVFHLSAGQMAVVSLAFCLSLNKVYNTNEGFKLLAIDDPIQTMDNLNIHSFVELLRNEFSDYQIIMSTHDNFISRYMSYKFEKYEMKATIQNVQDLVLEQTFN